MKIIFLMQNILTLKLLLKKIKNMVGHLKFVPEDLDWKIVEKAKDFDAICAFVNSTGNKEVLDKLQEYKVKLWLQHSMGYNIVDVSHTNKLSIYFPCS